MLYKEEIVIINNWKLTYIMNNRSHVLLILSQEAFLPPVFFYSVVKS